MAEILTNDVRTMLFTREAVNEDGSIDISFSSETDQVQRWFGIEILSHEPGAMDMTRAALGLPFLDNHECDDLLGRVENIRIGVDRKGRGTVRFSSSPEAQQIRQDMIDGIRPDISVGYLRMEEKTQVGQGGAPDIVTVTRWMPYEISSATIPADITVGAGRTATLDTVEVIPTHPAAPAGTTRKESLMTPEEIAAAQKAAEELQRSQALLARNERTEALQLQQIATRAGLGQMASELLGSEKSLADVRGLILAEVAKREAQPLAAPNLDLTTKEAKQYSYARAILASACRQEGTPYARGFEDEVSDTISKDLPSGYQNRGGVFVPLSLRAGLDSGASTAGAELKFTQYGGELIELLRNFAAVIGMGARVLPGLQGPVTFPKQTGAGTAYWLAENGGSDATASALALGTVSLAQKTLQATTSFSRQLLTQSVLAVEPMVREDLAAIHALAIDKAAIHGTGASNQPTGIYRTASVGATAMGGVKPTFGKLQDMITAVAVANALNKKLGWLCTPGLAGALAQTLVASAAGSDMIWKGKYDDGMVNGYKAIATNQVSALMNVLVDTGGSSHGMLFGNWDDLLIGMWGALEIITDPYALKKQGMIEVTSFQLCDVQIRHAASFSVATGATLS